MRTITNQLVAVDLRLVTMCNSDSAHIEPINMVLLTAFIYNFREYTFLDLVSDRLIFKEICATDFLRVGGY